MNESTHTNCSSEIHLDDQWPAWIGSYLVIAKEPHSWGLVILVVGNKHIVGAHAQDLVTMSLSMWSRLVSYTANCVLIPTFGALGLL